ncbi:Hypothetical protein R9X50_00609600 [Acrodontium crateriforme]|uniref:NADH-cytochrome b5 reductase n=1 Tax=Acrodontium crateriforme TaxID=150365 RepID=A0AAQ3M899_9PEZI|nr:Hypothetical protein R9X50_00609600 [Acrodontium crateriforme]
MTSPLSSPLFLGSSAVIIIGTAVFKAELLPYAVAVAATIGLISSLVGGGGAAKARKPVLIPDQFQNFPITKINKISHNTAIYRFGLPHPDDILGLPIGQHISLAATLPVTDPKTGETQTKEVVRSYTPISCDEVDKGYFDLLIKSYPTGNISRHIATLKVGDEMKVRGPKGAMIYTPNMSRSIGMIAGGTGITPMLQVARAILRGRNGGDRTEVNLIFANVDEKDILLRDELTQLEKEDDRFKVYYVLNNPPEGWKGGVGFVTADMIKERFAAPAKDVKILLCGPPPMISAMKKACESLGYDKARPVAKLDDQVFGF